MKNTIYVEGIKKYLIGESGVNSIVARLSAKYKMLPQQFIRKGDDEIIINVLALINLKMKKELIKHLEKNTK